MATILQRKEENNADEIWYVTDNRQSLHFEQIFRATRKAKLVEDDVVLEHIPFGTMNGKDGKPFKTRDGGVLQLNDLINQVKDELDKKMTNFNNDDEKKKDIIL